MPNTKLTRAALSNHFHYGKYIYAALILAAWMLTDLVYTATEYQSPNERKVDIQMVGAFSDVEKLGEVARTALEAGQRHEINIDRLNGVDVDGEEYEPPLEEVSFYSIDYDTENKEDPYGVQKYMVTVAAQQGDIYFVNRVLMEQLVNEGVAIPLEGYIEAGILEPGDRDLDAVTFSAPQSEEGGAPGDTHVYALRADTLYRLIDEGIYDMRGTYMIITVFSANPETTAVVMQSIIDQLETEKPEWLN
jgi:hypothetical protein